MKRVISPLLNNKGRGNGSNTFTPHSDTNYDEKGSDITFSANLLKGKTVLVTGAGRNIGKAIALEAGLNGAKVIFTDNHDGRKQALERELQQRDIQCIGFCSDISRRTDIDDLMKSLTKQGISIDTVIHNVGAQECTRFPKGFNILGWENTFQTNVFGPMYLTKELTDRMIQESIPGSFIFITSIHQWIFRHGSEYSASKAALGMIIQELALELATFNIRVNGIAPGIIWEDDSGRPKPHNDTPLYKRSIKPCYIGRAAVYLSSDYFSKFTTGTVLKIDAGLSLHSYLSLE